MNYQPSQKLLDLIKNNNITVIGITGKMMSGKDTLANFLHFAFSDSRITWFAYPMKQMMIDYFGFTKKDLYDSESKKEFNSFWGMTNREALQKIGTDCFRNNFHKDTWLKTMEVNIIQDPKPLIIIPDVRFPNEAQLINSLGGVVIKLNRPNNITENYTQHVSETSIDHINADVTIQNDADLVTLFIRTFNVLKVLKLYPGKLVLNPHKPYRSVGELMDIYLTTLELWTRNNYYPVED